MDSDGWSPLDEAVGSDPGGRFAPAVDRWVELLGRVRDVVRQDVLAGQLDALVQQRGAQRRRVLDAGCGQGTQALRLARAGHDVTGLDPSAELLGHFRAALDAEPAEVRDRVRLVEGTGEEAPLLAPGPYDLVLCHGVLMYLDDPTPLLSALTGVAADDAVLSLLVRNGLAPAMRDGLRASWGGALDAFDSLAYVNRMGVAAHAHRPSDLEPVLAPLGWAPGRWYGVRVFTDHRDGPPPTGDELRRMLAAEREAGGRDPYRQVAALLHLTYERAP